MREVFMTLATRQKQEQNPLLQEFVHIANAAISQSGQERYRNDTAHIVEALQALSHPRFNPVRGERSARSNVVILQGMCGNVQLTVTQLSDDEAKEMRNQLLVAQPAPEGYLAWFYRVVTETAAAGAAMAYNGASATIEWMTPTQRQEAITLLNQRLEGKDQ